MIGVIARRHVVLGIPLLALVAALAASVYLFTPDVSRLDTSKRVPVDESFPGSESGGGASANLAGEFRKGEGEPANIAGEWLNFRGDKFDAISREELELNHDLTQSPPPKLWQIDVGEGYAGPAVRDGRVYLLDYDAKARADVLRCLSLANGKEIWSRSYGVDVKRNHGMSRTVPAISGKYVVTLGPKCHVLCVDAETGDYVWGMDLVKQYRTKVPPWYAGQCPLVVDGKAIFAPGGSALMIAVDCATGKVEWETPNPRAWDMTHTSIAPMEFNGASMLVYAGSGGVAGVDAKTGKLLWDTTAWRVKIAAVPSPVPLEDGRILLTGGYDAGAMMIRLVPSGDGYNVEKLWTAKPDVFGAEQQTPIYFGQRIYGCIPGGQFVCLDPATGKQIWSSGANRFGIGPFMVAGGVVWITSDTGVLSAIAADPGGYRLLGSSTVLDHGHEAWGPMAMAGGRLLVRDLTRLACVDIRAAKH